MINIYHNHQLFMIYKVILVILGILIIGLIVVVYHWIQISPRIKDKDYNNLIP